MELNVVFTGDSANYHIFQVVESGDCVGSIYIRKDSDNGVPETAELNFITPSRDKRTWVAGMSELIEKARDGSKAKNKLIKTLKSYK
jgi:hypothetical protein